jgi:hypothetical protein
MDTKLYLTIAAVAAILYALAFLLFPVNASLISSGSCNLRAKAGSPASSIVAAQLEWHAAAQAARREPADAGAGNAAGLTRAVTSRSV